MTLTNQDIVQVLRLCKSGNQQAQMEIYERYYKAMYNIAYRIVKNSFEAEDIMQESFLSAFTKLDSLKELRTFSSWLKRIVINNSIQHYKKNTKYQEIPLDDVLYKIEDDFGITQDYDFKNLKAKQVLETMNSLKHNYRTSLTLHLIEGYDYEEIGEIMSITASNCRTMISRAKESLRQKLEAFA
ncbi:MAG: RNA polymerase sigma factor [Psychroserpens sp.]|uniref:RNA polymerase sigma factor n=1 Tax=Psychroserpens sp. TaxID=2020870 RepID=UPI003CB542D3